MSEKAKPFGHYNIKFASSLILLFVKMGLARGAAKKILSNLFIHFNKNNPVDVIYENLKIRLHPQDNTIENKILLSSKKREGAEIEAIKPFISNNTIFLDIGANIGYYSLMVAQMGAKKILAFEPNPIMVDRLKQNINFNDFNHIINIIETALGDKKGKAELSIQSQDMGASSSIIPLANSKQIKVNVSPLIEALHDENLKTCDILKIDVEGMEDKILFPFFKATNIKDYPLIIIIEDNSKYWEDNILKWLLEHHYQVLCQTRGNYVLQKAIYT